ncbi:sensor histidine kinase [Nonomuraea rhodomycinica]|uniref:histidine kinase n=1 Tax=Nonomuraea rhodomycinica TaxID=1712872 RepID=A0A7Y6IYV0_9ACTN|nr:nitrate- and nitrite sensing domain-containing protein [Nonomuraea rhodomycinica]NUW46931.1 nitrate- and nitrite sensing domain-containing protein [Nonomuraea rhodomycinica]
MRTRLVALILIPTVVGVLLAGVQLANSIGTSAEYRRLTQIAELVQSVGAMSDELGKERTLTAWYIAEGRRSARRAQLNTQRDAVNTVRKRVLAAVSALDPAHSPRTLAEAEEIRRWLTGLDGLRQSIGQTGSAPPRAALRTFSSMIEVMSKLQDELAGGTDDDAIGADVVALGALQRAKEEVSRQQGILVVALVERKLDYDDLSDFLGSWNRQQQELTTFEEEARADDLKAYRKNMRGLQIDRADAMRQRALAQLREYKLIRDLDITATPRRELNLWHESTSLQVSALRKVEDGLTTRIVTETRELSDSEQRSAIISGAMILALLLLVLVITTRVAGSLVRPLRRLRAEALQVATTRLPETVRVLRESGEGAALPEVPSIGVNTRDEIGEVARAFDEVHREAIRLAGDEAKLRANVNAMFVNLSRRSQTLVERQLQLIEGLEQGEEDENRLANLFRLDHLATRMRRNSENLLVLAGQEAARKWSEPVPLVDVARASLSEVENYERVQIQIPSNVQIAGPAVTDAVHLLAELIENAISFSPRESKVQVTSSAVDGGVLVTINDLGIGMSADELAEANWRLANPPVVDVAVSRRMGLFVVGRLALRHGVGVQLRMRETGGLSALVMLPNTLIVGAQGAGGVPQQRGQYEAFTDFDPSMFGEPSFEGAASNGSGAYASPTAAADPRSDAPVDTEWPGSLPAPGTGNWPSFAEEQPRPDEPRWPGFGDEQPAAAQEDRWGSFADPAPAQEERWGSFADPAPAQEERWGSFADPAPAQDVPNWPSFATEPPPMREEPETRWPSFGEQPAASLFTPAEPARPYGDDPSRPPFGDEPPRPSFGDEPSRSPFGDEPSRPSFGDEPSRSAFGDDGGSPFGDEYRWPSFAETVKPADSFAPNGQQGFDPFGPGEYSSQDMTGPLPVVRTSAMEPPSEEFLPIFSSVGSDWFRKPDPEVLRPREQEPEESETAVQPAVRLDGPPPAPPLPKRGAPDAQPESLSPSGLPRRRPGESGAGAAWSSPADSGFQAAQAAAQPAQGGTTSSGLPRRVPKANLVPGTASLAEPQVQSPAPQISPDRLRSRLSSFQQGVRQGRAFTRGEGNEEEEK